MKSKGNQKKQKKGGHDQKIAALEKRIDEQAQPPQPKRTQNGRVLASIHDHIQS